VRLAMLRRGCTLFGCGELDDLQSCFEVMALNLAIANHPAEAAVI
jgi:hypothetical protein